MPEYDATHFSPPAPIARVSLIHPKTDQTVQDVPMLLDTGADVSLVSAETLRALGIEMLPEEYGLEGFNGTPVTVASAYLYLHFLGRTFRGRFLVVNQSIGILGRNVLNHLALLLDGPRQHWREFMGHSSGLS
jgi:hypothetical protein